MLSRNRLFIILATASLTVTTALAQRQSDVREGTVRPFPGFWGILDLTPKTTLIAAKQVQVDFKITAEQTTELAELERKSRNGFGNFGRANVKVAGTYFQRESTDEAAR